MSITIKDKEDIFKKFGGDVKNTGSVFSQIALFTNKISHLTNHLASNKKDYGTQRSLQLMVGKRRKLLNYLSSKHIERYREIIAKLDIRK